MQTKTQEIEITNTAI